jgi:hypothetical protein
MLIERLNDPISSVMKSVLSRYATYYNKKYNKTGHVFQGRYHSIICQKENYLLALVRYIHLNPVRAGLAETPDAWEWSSYRSYFGEEPPLDIDVKTILSNFGDTIERAQNSFADFISEGIGDGVNIYPSAKFPVLGNSKFIEKISWETGELRRKIRPQMRMNLDELNLALCKRHGLGNGDIRTGSKRDISRIRAVFNYIANIYCGYRIIDIAKYISKNSSSVTRSINKIRKNQNKVNKIEGIVQSLKR